MADNKINLPSSGAGITRYFEDSKSKFGIKPIYVVVAIVIVIVVELYLYKAGL